MSFICFDGQQGHGALLVSRKFETPPLIVGGVPQVEADKAKSVITESVTRPVVVPMVLAHYGIGEWPMGGQRFAFLLTGGAGVNPFASSADFGAGVSFAFRNFMVSPLLHFGRDLRLTNGLTVGLQFVGTPSLSTERYWVRQFGIAISIGTPIK